MLFGSIQSFAHIYFYINNMSFVNWRYHASTARNIVCYTLRLQKCVECDNYHKKKEITPTLSKKQSMPVGAALAISSFHELTVL